MEKSLYYILDGKKPIPCNQIEFLSLNQDRKIEKTFFEGVEVSTVFLGLSHGSDNGLPILFETLVFGGEFDGYMVRYTNFDDALIGHSKVCYMVDKIAIDRENKLKNLGL